MIAQKKSTADAIKTASKRAIHKREEATGDSIVNKNADKITSESKSPASSQNDDANNETKVPKKDTYLQKKDNKL